MTETYTIPVIATTNAIIASSDANVDKGDLRYFRQYLSADPGASGKALISTGPNGAAWTGSPSVSGAFSAGSVSAGSVSADSVSVTGVGTGLAVSHDATFGGAIAAASATLSGALSAASASLSGALGAASATLSGALSAASATLSGALSAASASISGAVSAGSVSADSMSVAGVGTALAVSHDATFGGAIAASSAAISGSATVGGTLGVTGTATMAAVNGTTINGSADVQKGGTSVVARSTHTGTQLAATISDLSTAVASLTAAACSGTAANASSLGAIAANQYGRRKIGTFSGNGGSSRAITTGFQCAYVRLIGTNGAAGVTFDLFSTTASLNTRSSASGGGAAALSATVLDASDGFVVDGGTDGSNATGNYIYIAIG